VTIPDLVSRVNDLVTGRIPTLLGEIYQPGFGPAPEAAIEVPPRPGR